MHRFKRKPRKCPECGSRKIASILWGLPLLDAGTRQKIETGKIVLGGCLVGPERAEWSCVDCLQKFYRKI